MLIVVYILISIMLVIFLLFVCWMIFAIPAAISLPHGIRDGLDDITIDEAVQMLKEKNITGYFLIEEARKLIVTRMQYCRRNSFDRYKTAFRRGHGYCHQQAFALCYILNHLGFDAKVVHAFRNKFPDGRVTGHAWIRVSYNGITKDIDATDVDLTTEKLTFKSLTKVKEYSTLFRYFAGWGSIGVNAWRYYKTGEG